MIILIAAMDKHGVIGNNNQLPWHLPADLQWFKQMTTGNAVIMGRKTYESIGKPLPNRRNIILSRDESFDVVGGFVVEDMSQALFAAQAFDYAYVIGGATVYEQFMPYANRLILTRIDESFEGDTYFPPIDETIWEKKMEIKGPKNDANPYDYYFQTFDRRREETE